ncbi:hypothetical protein CsSME_00005212 [Camellia sinensis var. sinensis]
MANDGQKVKVGVDTPTKNGKHIDSDVEEINCNEETRDKNHEGKDVGQESDKPKKTDRSGFYNEDDLQPLFSLQDVSILAAKKDAQKMGQKKVPAVHQHGETKGHSHRPSREVSHGESQKTRSRPR